MFNKAKLSEREKEVMTILWKANKPMIASEICKSNPDLSINTVNFVVKSLLKKNFIKVDNIVYSGTVLSRNYIPLVSADEYIIQNLKTQYHCLNISVTGIISALLEDEKNEAQTIDELEKILLERKKNLKSNKEYGK